MKTSHKKEHGPKHIKPTLRYSTRTDAKAKSKRGTQGVPSNSPAHALQEYSWLTAGASLLAGGALGLCMGAGLRKLFSVGKVATGSSNDESSHTDSIFDEQHEHYGVDPLGRSAHFDSQFTGAYP